MIGAAMGSFISGSDFDILLKVSFIARYIQGKMEGCAKEG